LNLFSKFQNLQRMKAIKKKHRLNHRVSHSSSLSLWNHRHRFLYTRLFKDILRVNAIKMNPISNHWHVMGRRWWKESFFLCWESRPALKVLYWISDSQEMDERLRVVRKTMKKGAKSKLTSFCVSFVRKGSFDTETGEREWESRDTEERIQEDS
jgi:hypothetical protein